MLQKYWVSSRLVSALSPLAPFASVVEQMLGNFAYDSSGVGIFATAIGIITDGKITPVS